MATNTSLAPVHSASYTHSPQTPLIYLQDINPENLSKEFKKKKDDWYVIYNPSIKTRKFDINLLHTFEHISVVCCVKFSFNGKYLATGCNRSAQIFDVETGECLSVLQDESVQKEGDLYIRSICYSPDGVFLATGAEDNQIRVSHIFFMANY